jgi:hypothetical protein
MGQCLKGEATPADAIRKMHACNYKFAGITEAWRCENWLRSLYLIGVIGFVR